MALPLALAVLAYFDAGTSLLWAGAAALASAVLLAERARPPMADWGVVLVLLYEIPSLAASRYAANGLPFTKAMCGAAIGYFLVRLSVRTAWQSAALSALVGMGGVALAWFGLAQAGERIGAMQANGFSDVVALRSMLIAPPAPWVAGEWFTLLLLTLAFALAVAAFCRLRWRGAWPLAAVGLPIPIG